MNDRLRRNLSDFPIFKTTEPMRMNDVEVASPLQIPSVHGKRGVNPARRIDPGRLHQLYLIASSCLRFGDTANPILQAAQTCYFADMEDLHILYLEAPSRCLVVRIHACRTQWRIQNSLAIV